MKALLGPIVALVVLFEFIAASSFNLFALTKFNDFVKTPESQEIINIGGRLDERHLAYLSEAGYKSLLSVVVFATNDTVYNGVEGPFPSTDYEMQLVQSQGMVGKYYPSTFTIQAAQDISNIIEQLPKPLYVHCHVGFTASLFTQLHLYLKNQVLSSDIYANGLHLGYDYQNISDVVSLINSLTGRQDAPAPEKIEQPLAAGEYSYKYYYSTHRLGDSDLWYNAGQILSTQVDAIVTAGYKTIISFRTNGEATAHLPTDPSGAVNNHEFSDENGLYSIALEEHAVKQAGLDFSSLPIETGDWTVETFKTYSPILAKAVLEGPVLVHCASGYRSAAFTLTFLAYGKKLCTDWVLDKGKEVGFDYHSPAPTSSDAEILNFMYNVLKC